MFCPKCGTENPNDARYCRTCRTDIGLVTDALSGKLRSETKTVLLSNKGRPITWENAFAKFFVGFALVVIAIILAATGVIGGKVWWFWLLIPAFMSIGKGIGQLMQLRSPDQNQLNGNLDREISSEAVAGAHFETPALNSSANSSAVDEIFAQSKYKTDELIAPPSVAEGTTRLLERDPVD